MKRVYQALGTGKLFFVTWFLSIAFNHYYIQRSLDVLAYIRNIDRKIARHRTNPLPSSGLINIRCIYITSMPWLINPIHSTIIVIFISEWQSNNNKHIYLWCILRIILFSCYIQKSTPSQIGKILVVEISVNQH